MSAGDESSSKKSRPTAESLLDGTPYRFVATVGRGGMGEVVEAEHVELGKRVVVKLLHGPLTRRPDLVDRLRLEAQSLARLSHDNLVAVFDRGVTRAGRPYLVMDRLVGRTLRVELAQRGGTLPASEAVEIGRQALAGLAAAHAVGVVHRDVKLDNIFVCDGPTSGRRRIKVIDFGIAKVVGTDPLTPDPLAWPTDDGVALGTPRFFSPEQARGERVDARADVYAMGLVLYVLLAGRGPFDHERALYALSEAHARREPLPPSRFAPQRVPPRLERAVMRALRKRADERFPSAIAFAAELASIAVELERGGSGPPSSPRPTVPPPSPRSPPRSSSRAPSRGSRALRHPPDGISPGRAALLAAATAALLALATLASVVLGSGAAR